MDQWTRIEDAPLYNEHLLLGAQYFESEPLLAAPPSYGNQKDELDAFEEGCALSDLCGMTMLLITGENSYGFCSASLANSSLAVGQSEFTAVLSGDGSLCATPLASRTGDNEHLLCDPTERGLGLEPWLSFLASIEQKGFRPFEGVKVEDVSTSLLPLLLWGPKAQAVLGDYVSSLDKLPKPGHVASVMLDRIQCIVCAPDCHGETCYLLLVPPQAARVLWRSFLSFPVVQPAGLQSLVTHAESVLPWLDDALSPDRIEPTLSLLSSWKLARKEGGFVGARALAQ